jgi:PKD repeat protein
VRTATEYVVTATNASGSATRTFTLTVTLAVPAFTMSSYSESVVQNSAITGYTITSSGGVVARRLLRGCHLVRRRGCCLVHQQR